MKILFRVFLGIVLVLIAIGGILQIGATVSLNNDYVLYFKHIGKIFAGILALGLGMAIPLDIYKKHSKKIMLVGVTAILLTLIMGISKKGASRWLYLGFMTFQPVEFVKVIIIIHLANLIAKKEELIKDFKRGYMPVMFWIAVTIFLIILQPNLSAAIMIFVVGFSMLFVANASLKHLLITGLIAAILGGAVMMSFDHSRARILSKFGITEKAGINLQQYQSDVALGSGGLTGKGPGQSRQSDSFLPEAYGDFVYAILGEQYGFIGTVLVLLAYLVLFVLGTLISYMAEDKFSKLLGFGLTLGITINALVNMAVVSGAFPVTGVTLPFISYGGSSLVAFSFAAGMILKISKVFIKSKELEISNESVVGNEI